MNIFLSQGVKLWYASSIFYQYILWYHVLSRKFLLVFDIFWTYVLSINYIFVAGSVAACCCVLLPVSFISIHYGIMSFFVCLCYSFGLMFCLWTTFLDICSVSELHFRLWEWSCVLLWSAPSIFYQRPIGKREFSLASPTMKGNQTSFFLPKKRFRLMNKDFSYFDLKKIENTNYIIF